jgi:putative acetyltransferase
MTTKHVPKVIELWEETEGLILTPTDNALDLDTYFCHNPGMSHVSIREGKIVGAVLCGHDGRRGYLHHLAVDASCRNQGIGRTLVNACLSKLREVGIRQCNLFVIDNHANGRAFWMNDKWEEWPNIRLMSKKIDEM